MQQAPATPKLRRWSNLSLARLGLMSARRIAQLQLSERLSLELRQQPRISQSKATQVVFLLPLVRKSHVKNWAQVEENLNTTLASFQRQSDPNWLAVICGQDKPNTVTDDRIIFLPFEEHITGNDKWAKLARLIDYYPQVAHPSGYIMTYDADDIAHRDLVKLFLQRQHPNGYLIDHGLVYDTRADSYGQAGAPTLLSPLRKPFWKLCGSCSAFRYDPKNPPMFRKFLAALCQHEHRMFPYLASLAAQPLYSLRINLVIYKINHGENFDRRLNQGDFKLGFVKRFVILDEQKLQQIRDNFF